MQIKDWVVPLLLQWGREKKRALRGGRRFADGSIDADGSPTISMAAFMREGGITGGSGDVVQHFEEVYSKNGLMVWQIYRTSPIEVQRLVFAHYVADGNIKRKAKELGLSVAWYWQRLDNALYYFAGRIDRRDEQEKVPT